MRVHLVDLCPGGSVERDAHEGAMNRRPGEHVSHTVRSVDGTIMMPVNGVACMDGSGSSISHYLLGEESGGHAQGRCCPAGAEEAPVVWSHRTS